jgi:hypothetical protein
MLLHWRGPGLLGLVLICCLYGLRRHALGHWVWCWGVALGSGTVNGGLHLLARVFGGVACHRKAIGQGVDLAIGQAA